MLFALAAACLVTLTAGARSPLDVFVAPSDCTGGVGGDCFAAFRDAAQRCGLHDGPCAVVLAPGRYRATCPPYAGLYAYVRTPGAVDLSNLSDVSFGAVDPAQPAYVDADYAGAGCPVIAARRANNVTLRNLVLDTTRLPFTEAVVTEVTDAGRIVRLALRDPAHGAFDVQRYPWLQTIYDDFIGPNVTGFVNSSWDPSLGVATLLYAAPDAQRAAIPAGTPMLAKHFINMHAWGVYGLGVTGTFLLTGVTLRSAAGMGLRCDFCAGEWEGVNASVSAGPNRGMSTTADGIHFMSPAGRISLRDSQIDSTGDDCFNTHGNFVVLMNVGVAGDALRATYVDETGPGWLPEAATLMVGDAVQFYSRLELQPLGAPTVLLAATGGFGPNATLLFRDIPPGVRPYDMFLSLARRPSFAATGNTLLHGARPQVRGFVVSALGVHIAGNLFRGLGGSSVLFMNGGCGAYEDYTEGPFSEDILIANNTFDRADPAPQPSGGKFGGGIAVVQATGCVPASCGTAPPPAEPYPMPPCAPGGSSRPPIVPHDGDTDGPGRLYETGAALPAAADSLFRNITIMDNAFTSSSRFVDIGVADGVVIEGNTMIAVPGGGAPSGGAICLYGSVGYNATAIAARNRCFNDSAPVACSFCA
jgi:hypothetical protein